MKRILRAASLGLTVSMLFTGCGSSALVNGLVGGYEEIAWDIIETDPNRSQWGEAGLAEGETTAAFVMPDYYEQNEQDREAIIKNQAGTSAFKMKDGHSQHSQDLEMFEVINLLNDGTFVYYYSTRVGERPEDYDETKDTRKMVHCVATYNYKTQAFKILHEREFTRTTSEPDDENEAFYVQMCKSDGTGDIFVYDKGIGYIFNSAGNIEFQTEIGTFIRTHFNGASVIATEAMTDGNNRIYVNLTIEKEEISVPDEDEGDDISEEEADKEAEALDQEMDSKTIEVVLVYDFKTYDEIGTGTKSLDQSKLNLDAQISHWQQLRNISAGYLSWEPPAEGDWTSTLNSVPSQWGTVFLYGLTDWPDAVRILYGISEPYHTKGTPVFQWTTDKSFGYTDGYVSSLIPKYGSYKPFTDLKANTELSNVFTFIDNHYYELYGTIGDDLGEGEYDSASFSRVVKRVDDVKKEDGSTERIETLITQTLSKGKKRDTYPSNCYFEGYWVDSTMDMVMDVIDGELFCMKGNGIYLRNADGTYYEMNSGMGEDVIVDLFKQDGNYYISFSADGYTIIYEYNSDKTFKTFHLISSEQVMNVIKEVEYLQSEVDEKYHSKYDEWTKDETQKPADSNAGELLGGDNLLFVTLSNPQTELLKKIEENENIEIPTVNSILGLPLSQKLSTSTGNGCLITSLTHGLVYLDSTSAKAICLDDGSWYGVWKQGDSYVAVGFPDSTSDESDDEIIYGSMDVAHAKILEFKIDDLYKDGLEKILKSASPDVVEPEEEESEGTKKMQEEFDAITATKEDTFVDPDYEDWSNRTPGEYVKQKEEERQKAKEESKNATEEKEESKNATEE